MIDITIAIVNWNTGDLLSDCLGSISDTRGALALQTIVVDNGSTDGSAQQAQRAHPWAEYIFNEGNPGFSAANNKALARSKGQYFLMLNPDTILMPGALQGLVDFLIEHPTAAAVGPRLVYGDGRLQRSWTGVTVSPCSILADTLGWKIFGTDPLNSSIPVRETQVEGIMGACILFRKAAIEQVGPMDEKFFLVYEEADWCRRLIHNKWSIWYLPGVTVKHFCGQSSKHLEGRGAKETMISLRYYIGKHYGAINAAALASILAIIYSWRLFKTNIKLRLSGSTLELTNRRILFQYYLKGLLARSR